MSRADDLRDPNDIKPSLCETVGQGLDLRVRDLTVGDILDYLNGIPRETPIDEEEP